MVWGEVSPNGRGDGDAISSIGGSYQALMGWLHEQICSSGERKLALMVSTPEEHLWVFLVFHAGAADWKHVGFSILVFWTPLCLGSPLFPPSPPHPLSCWLLLSWTWLIGVSLSRLRTLSSFSSYKNPHLRAWTRFCHGRLRGGDRLHKTECGARRLAGTPQKTATGANRFLARGALSCNYTLTRFNHFSAS